MSKEMDKIVIIGSPGAGKSTLAQQLGQTLNIEVFHLDRYFWQDGWKEYPREERVRIQQELMRGEQWIMEGSYISSADDRLDAADTIIFLDTPRLLCLWRVIKRHITASRDPVRPDIPDGCTDRLRPIYLLKVLVFPYKGRIVLRKKIRVCRQSEPKEMYTLNSNQRIEAFLREQSIRQLQGQAVSQLPASSTEQSKDQFVGPPQEEQSIGPLQEQQEAVYAACEPVPAGGSELSPRPLMPARFSQACYSKIWFSLWHLFFSGRQQPQLDHALTLGNIPSTPLAPT